MLNDAAKRLANLEESVTEARPAADKWSAKEILGHLIDSAVNNHIRFVNGQFQDDLIFPGYDQEKWVEAHKYQQVPWESLLVLWQAYNRHLLYVIACADEKALTRTTTDHNFDRIAKPKYKSDQPFGLIDLFEDYLDHLEHHLKQIYALVSGK
jgi:hypothetical protein